jgi:osmotically-inducible protein OsmY
MEDVMCKSNSLYTDIMNKLKFDPDINESNITIAIKDEGIIILGGKVGSYIEKKLAEEAVEKINTVKAVANEIDVVPSINYQKTDVEIAEAVVHALYWTYLVPDQNIKVSVDKGRITLTGNVEYNYQKEYALKAVQGLSGITFINNHIKVTPIISPFEVKSKIIQEFERNARIDARNITVEVDDNEVILKGNVRNFDERREARNAAWSISGVTSVVDLLGIEW